MQIIMISPYYGRIRKDRLIKIHDEQQNLTKARKTAIFTASSAQEVGLLPSPKAPSIKEGFLGLFV